MRKDTLYRKYWEEKNEQDTKKGRTPIWRSGLAFNLFDDKDRLIKDMMKWAYEKGKRDVKKPKKPKRSQVSFYVRKKGSKRRRKVSFFSRR